MTLRCQPKIAAAIALGAALLLAGCKPPAASEPANSPQAPAASVSSASPGASDSAPVLSGDAVRDLAKLSVNDLRHPSTAKTVVLAQYFGVEPGKPRCPNIPAFSQNPFDEVCAWAASKDQDFPTILIALDTSGPSPHIWSAVVATHAYGPEPLGPLWHCASATNPELLICALGSMVHADRVETVQAWERYFDSVN